MPKEPKIFIVTDESAPEKKSRLVQAATPGAVKAYLLRDTSVSVASPLTVARLMGEGVKVEEAGE